MRSRATIAVVALVLLAATTVSAQPSGPMRGARITRVTDLVMACQITLIWTVGPGHPGARYNFGRPHVSHVGEVTTVTWTRVRISDMRGHHAVTCRVEPTRITSLTLGEVETLREPQPY